MIKADRLRSEKAKVEDITFLFDQRDPQRRKMLLAERDQEYDDGVRDKYLRDTRGTRVTRDNNNNCSPDQQQQKDDQNDITDDDSYDEDYTV